jgi:hypothetical protein
LNEDDVSWFFIVEVLFHNTKLMQSNFQKKQDGKKAAKRED